MLLLDGVERARRADFVLRVPVDLGVLNFDEPRRIARKGARVARAHLEELKKAIGVAGSPDPSSGPAGGAKAAASRGEGRIGGKGR